MSIRPRIVIAGTNSGCGKTTIAMGIMAALVKRGMKVQPFKVGPDYIDPIYHTLITGKKSRNLDSWMMAESIVQYLFCKNSEGADVSVIEGVMGLYDGLGGTELKASTADVSKIIQAPVVLVVNAEGMSLSLAALVKGFVDFDPGTDILGIIINKVSGDMHYKLLKKVVEQHFNLAVLGYLPKNPQYSLESRHLGLIPGEEIEGLTEKINVLSAQMEATVDLDRLLVIANKRFDNAFIRQDSLKSLVDDLGFFPEVLKDQEMSFQRIKDVDKAVTIAVAKDKAFNFYYEDNLDLLKALGAQIVYFSPLVDKHLPDGIDGLYIGGGYPEVYARDLKHNVEMRQDIYNKVMQGLPSYAECGGLMYLSESITDSSGDICEMVGLISGHAKMTGSLQRFGYVQLTCAEDVTIARKGDTIKAHEFHYSILDTEQKTCFHIVKNENRSWHCGYQVKNLTAGYPHLHFWGNSGFAQHFVEACFIYSKHNKDYKHE